MQKVLPPTRFKTLPIHIKPKNTEDFHGPFIALAYPARTTLLFEVRKLPHLTQPDSSLRKRVLELQDLDLKERVNTKYTGLK
jgi:hypothetical protein